MTGIETQPEFLRMLPIPKALWGLNPRTLLGAQWWRERRLEAIGSTRGHCLTCGEFFPQNEWSRLEGHEVYTIDYLTGESYYEKVIPVCNACHSYIHIGRTKALNPDWGEYVEHRGRKILSQAGLPTERPQIGFSNVEFEEWRLIIEGEEYRPKWKSEKECDEYFLSKENWDKQTDFRLEPYHGDTT